MNNKEGTIGFNCAFFIAFYKFIFKNSLDIPK